MHKKDLALLEEIKNFFCVGKIYKHGLNSIQFKVFSVKGIKVIIEHFNKFPMITQKRADLILFKQVLSLVECKLHLTTAGLNQIFALKASMNLGLSPELKLAFPNVKPTERPLVTNQTIKDPN